MLRIKKIYASVRQIKKPSDTTAFLFKYEHYNEPLSTSALSISVFLQAFAAVLYVVQALARSLLKVFQLPLNASCAAFTPALREATSLRLHAADKAEPRVCSAVTTVARAEEMAVSRVVTAEAIHAPSTVDVLLRVFEDEERVALLGETALDRSNLGSRERRDEEDTEEEDDEVLEEDVSSCASTGTMNVHKTPRDMTVRESERFIERGMKEKMEKAVRTK